MYEQLIEQAFQQAYEYKRSTYKDLDMWESIIDYIYQYSNDRRYKLHLLAACTSMRSATVTYRSVKYSVDHDFSSDKYCAKRI